MAIYGIPDSTNHDAATARFLREQAAAEQAARAKAARDAQAAEQAERRAVSERARSAEQRASALLAELRQDYGTHDDSTPPAQQPPAQQPPAEQVPPTTPAEAAAEQPPAPVDVRALAAGIRSRTADSNTRPDLRDMARKILG